MKYTEHKELLELTKSKLQPGVTINNENIGGTTIHTITKNDRLAMYGDGKIVLGVDGTTDKLIVVYKDKLTDVI